MENSPSNEICWKYHNMVRFASKRDKREGVCEHLCAGDPGPGGAVATTTRKDPSPSAGVAVGAKRPLEKGWRTFLPTPDHEGILLEFIHVVEGIASRAIETRLDILAGLFSKGSEMSNDLQALDLIASVLHIHMLQQEKAPSIHS